MEFEGIATECGVLVGQHDELHEYYDSADDIIDRTKLMDLLKKDKVNSLEQGYLTRQTFTNVKNRDSRRSKSTTTRTEYYLTPKALNQMSELLDPLKELTPIEQYRKDLYNE